MTDKDRDDSEEGRPKIKVTDRRLFDREGNPRPDAEEERTETPERPPETIGEADGATEPPASAGPAAPSRPASGGEPPAGEGSGRLGSRPQPPASGGQEPRSASGGPPTVEAAPASAGDEAPGDDGEPSRAADLPRDFSSFIESQYYETLLYLGAMPHPATGQVMEDLDMAQYKIDVLSMLQDKTEGNRTPEESKMLEDILYQLRMGYLQKSKVAKL